MSASSKLTCALIVLGALALFPDVVIHNADLSLASIRDDIPNRDPLAVIFPFFARFIDSLRADGRLDPWNPYIWGGTPAVGNPNVPLNPLLYAFFHLGRAGFVVAMNWFRVAQFAAAAVGLFLLARRVGLPRVPSVIGAALLTVSSAATWMTSVYAIYFHWVVIPWALLLLLSAERRHPFWTIAALSVLFYFQVTYGQAQMTLYTVYFLLLAIVWIFREMLPPHRPLIMLLVAYAVAAALAMHFLLPQLEFLSLTPDRRSTDWLLTAERYRVSPRYLINLVIPRLFWSPLTWWPRWNDGWSPWESFNVSLGVVFTLVAIFSHRTLLWRTEAPYLRRLKILALLLVVLNCTTLGGLVLVALNLGHEVPYSRATQWLLFPLLFAVMDQLSELTKKREAARNFALFLAVVAVALAVLSRHFDRYVAAFYAEAAGVVHASADTAASAAHAFLTRHHDRLADVFFHTLLTIAGVLLLVGFAGAFFRFTKLRLAALAAAALIGLVDQIRFHQDHRARGTHPYPYTEILDRKNPLLDALAARKEEWKMFSFTTLTGRMEPDTGLAPNENAIYGIPSVNGYTSYVLRHTEFEPPYHRGNWGYPLPEIALKLFAVRYLLLGPETAALPYRDRLAPIATFREYTRVEYRDAVPKYFFPERVTAGVSPTALRDRLKRNDFDPRAHSYVEERNAARPFHYRRPDCRARFHQNPATGSEASFAIENDCATPIYFAFPELIHPWWRYYLDGQRTAVRTINLSQRMIEIPPGIHRFEIRCVPMSWTAGLAISTTAAIALALASVWVGARRVRPFSRWWLVPARSSHG